MVKNYIECIDIVKRLVKELGVGFIVVDMMIQDIQNQVHREGAVFNEFNRSPALRPFYSSRDGNNFDTVTPLYDAIESFMNTPRAIRYEV